jgi:hypothetical protein
LPELEFDFVKIEAIESLYFGLNRNSLPKRDLIIESLLLHTILRKIRSTSVHSLGAGPNWFMKSEKAAAPAKHLAVAVNLAKTNRKKKFCTCLQKTYTIFAVICSNS